MPRQGEHGQLVLVVTLPAQVLLDPAHERPHALPLVLSLLDLLDHVVPLVLLGAGRPGGQEQGHEDEEAYQSSTTRSSTMRMRAETR